ncbi:hypothetical protein LTR70_001215 [Exophiala xenobiotica]|uniref:Uncharacterized protein n=1 Tax=Lithohypha guttulata TaxID=1690604 RepID=A0ABR0KKQ0_9EURO|nr:hypothetical protein LTR24_001466 [Lithohypha guttulata]KAK5328190.1 hypothetical protein LTR70_001215 [Exophiala xenobiotica]
MSSLTPVISCSLIIAPAVNGVQYGQPSIMELKKNQIQGTRTGREAHLYMQVKHGKPVLIDTKPHAVAKVCSISAVVDYEVKKNGPRDAVRYLALPEGDRSAYQKILQWSDQNIKEGRITILEECKATPAYSDWHIHDIAEKLKIVPVIDQVQPRLFDRLNHSNSKVFHVDTGDIRATYKNLPAGHPFRGEVVELVANGILKGWIFGRLARAIWATEEEYSEFKSELLARKAILAQKW